MKLKTLFLTLFFCSSLLQLTAQKYTNTQSVATTTQWEGATFNSAKTIAENLKTSEKFSFLNTILKDSTITETLANEEMVTLFVATNKGFETMPEAQRDSIFAHPKLLKSYVTFHAVPGRLDAGVIERSIKDNNGTAYFRTLEGTKLGATMRNGKLTLIDSENRTATITEANFYHKNGFFHIIDGILFPRSNKE
ncbi:fasciclin domain-containing protein [Cochleicola gelatinilyticus]|uniref:FAS1 domain-containing protein n=1 Tax=Cochleicola gelatinilyticus TaxID=1763537 RepID=A0A167HFU8_9FLAO|nr:fasciclin domain-containing protein [Cochleicola gelatinilyticus]OAB78563.1 hypothetical protein ULVI_08210 [Cochleicola gelatinilyticus]